MKDLAGVVVLYNPTDIVKENVLSYIRLVGKLFLIDNSTNANDKLFIDFAAQGNVIYIHQGRNTGIAHALNIGCNEAIKLGFHWILTMDQDSKFTNLTNETILNSFRCLPSNVAILFPDYLINGKIYDKLFKCDGENLITMTSGNILNLQVYKQIGEFNEDLFIDYVDIDYCLRINEAGYVIRKIEGVTLVHGLGKVEHRTFLGKTLIVTNHNYSRRYYITRNRLFIINKYKKQFPQFVKMEYKSFVNDFIKILLFESTRIKKIRSIVKGYIDYRKGRYGEYNVRQIK